MNADRRVNAYYAEKSAAESDNFYVSSVRTVAAAPPFEPEISIRRQEIVCDAFSVYLVVTVKTLVTCIKVDSLFKIKNLLII